MKTRQGRALLLSAGMRIANAGLGFSITVVLARALGSESYGLYAMAIVIASVCAIVGRFGLPIIVTRETASAAVSENWAHMRAVWAWAGRAAALFSLGVLAIGLIVLIQLRDGILIEQLQTYGLALCIVPFLALSELRAGALRGLQHVVLAQVPELIAKPGVMLLLALMLGIFVPATASAAMAMQLCAVGTAFALGAMFLWQKRPALLLRKTSSVTIESGLFWKAALAIALASGMNQINNYADILVLGMFWPVEDVGVYRVAFQVSVLCAFGLQLVNSVFSPMFARLYRQGDFESLQCRLTQGSLISTGVALLLAVPWLFSGEFLIERIFGPEFLASWPAMVVLIAAQVLNASFGPIGTLMHMTGFENYVARIMAVAAVANLALNFVCIPLFGILGAASATFITFTIWNVGLWWKARRLLSLNCHALAIFTAEKS